MFVESTLILLFIFDTALIYLLYRYNPRGTVNRFLSLLLIPITLTNFEVLLLFSAQEWIPFNVGFNLALFGAIFFFPLVYNFTFFFPRKQTTKKLVGFFLVLYIIPVILGISFILNVIPDLSFASLYDSAGPGRFLLKNLYDYLSYFATLIYMIVLLFLTTRRLILSLKLPILKNEKKTVLMMITGFIPLSLILLFNYFIFLPLKGGIYIYIAASLSMTIYFIILLFRFGFVDKKAVARVFILVPIFIAGLFFIFKFVLNDLNLFMEKIFKISTALSQSLEVILFVSIFLFINKYLDRRLGSSALPISLDFHRVLRNAAAELVHIIDLPSLNKMLNKIFIKELEIKQFCFLLKDSSSNTFHKLKPIAGLDKVVFPAAGELAEKLRTAKRAINIRQIALLWEQGSELEVLDSLKIVIVVPLFNGDELIGMWLIGEPGTAQAWYQAEIEELELFSSGFPVVIARCRTHSRAIAMEKKQARIEKMAALNEITSGIAHEIRNPMSIIDASAETIATKELTEKETQKLAGYIQEETDRISRLLTRMLSFKPLTEIKHTPTDVGIVVSHVFDLVDSKVREKDIRIELFCDKKKCIAFIDKEVLTQVCLNLILNAIDCMSEEHGIIKSFVNVYNDKIEILFKNNGPVIPEEIRKEIFNPFFTTKENGTGLGLSISLRLIKNAGGELKLADSAEETVFRILLPVYDGK